jgi:hypothetical protein
VSVNGKPAPFKTERIPSSQIVQPVVEFGLSGSNMIEIDFDATVEILPPISETKTGDSDKGLKIIRQEFREGQLTVIVEGLSQQIYKLGLANAQSLESVIGATLDGNDLKIQMPEVKEGEFVRHEIYLKMKR